MTTFKTVTNSQVAIAAASLLQEYGETWPTDTFGEKWEEMPRLRRIFLNLEIMNNHAELREEQREQAKKTRAARSAVNEATSRQQQKIAEGREKIEAMAKKHGKI